MSGGIERRSRSATQYELLVLNSDNEDISFSLIFNSTPAYLADHFPDNPVYPAFAQLDWILTAARHLKPQLDTFKFSSVKFKKPLTPDRHPIINCKQTDGKISFSITDGTSCFTTGTLHSGDRRT